LDPRSGRDIYIIKRDYRELMPLLRYRYRPSSEKVQEILNRNRDIHLSLEVQFQRRVAQILEQHVRKSGSQRGAAVVFDSHTGELLASVTYPWAEAPGQVIRTPMESEEAVQSEQEALIDRARYGVYTPGSSFKLVTASAALRKDANAPNQTYTCIRLPDGRVGNFIQGSRRPIRDDILDREPHGAVNMEKGLTLSCNAFFAQLGTYLVGAEELARTAGLFGIKASPNNRAQEIRPLLPWASYGQGQVTVTPLQMARVAATIANGGRMPYTWTVQEEAGRTPQPQLILSPAQARMLGGFMREVVTSGTGRSLSGLSVPVAGKTGTAELENQPSHAWFVGYAPYGNAASRQVAFAVLVENGSYGGRVAAPAAGEIVTAAASRGLIGQSSKQEADGRTQEADGGKQPAGGRRQ
jgi:cell division protein FtsI/penicillin-binding protein 2